jgi:V/A-type H+/Na+-transporting ATPase subunit A
MTDARIIKVSGPLVVAAGCRGSKMYDMVRVSEKKLIGEIVELKNDLAFIQVYEETAGIGPGEPVFLTRAPLSVELGPGLIGSIYDGIQRPLNVLRDATGDFISRGVEIPGLDAKKKWRFVPAMKVGRQVAAGDILGVVRETVLIEHRIMVPPGMKGELVKIKEGDFAVQDSVARIRTDGGVRDIPMMQRWPVRQQRPIKEKLAPVEPLTTGQRVIDTFFPIVKGGTACIPGPFGAGKTVAMHEIAKWSDAQVIVYVACGERGNECADLLLSFPELKDPRSGRPLLERTVIVANTSNMPVAAREASIYTGITIAEYFRDMGYSVAVMADSTSRWAEALREISGRLGELPGEAGYPAYLSSRLASFYERAARVRTLGGDEGSVTVIGAISPPGGDFSEPVTMHTRRFVRSFWALDPERARARFYPAVNPLTSYSEDAGRVTAWWQANGNSNWLEHRRRLLDLLGQQARLERMARIVGKDALPAPQQLTLLLADLANEALLQQSSFSPADRYCSPARQSAMLRLVMRFVELAEAALGRGVPIRTLVALPILPRLKRLGEEHGEDDLAGIEALGREVEAVVLALAVDHAP